MILLIKTNKESLHDNEFVNPIKNILGKDSKVINYKKLKKSDLEKANKVIISGTSLKDNEFLKDLKKFSWIKNYNKPILGICAGAQIIGITLGGKLKKKTEIGMTKINFKKSFLGTSGEKEVYELHNNYVTFVKDFEIFAENKIPQAAKHKDREIYCVLFHPEVGNKDTIKNFILD
jgi:GMP synthase (glutamine-hydrolysing)